MMPSEILTNTWMTVGTELERTSNTSVVTYFKVLWKNWGKLRNCISNYFLSLPRLESESFWIGPGSSTAWAYQSGSIASYCISVVAFLTMYLLELYLESAEIMDDCFVKLHRTGRESRVVYFTAFIKRLPHANSKVTNPLTPNDL
jgi:hypothetical protein